LGAACMPMKKGRCGTRTSASISSFMTLGITRGCGSRDQFGRGRRTPRRNTMADR
jgi:hypothetical protein